MTTMNIEAIKTVAVRNASRGALLARKYSPQILTGVGIVGGVTAAVMGAKATLKLEPIVEELNENVKKVKAAETFQDAKGRHVTATEQVTAKALASTYTRGVINIVKLYMPAASLGAASIGCIIAAQGIMQRRNAALVAAYTVLEKGFNEYRARVEDALGEDQERELRYGVEEVEEVDEDGKKKIVAVADPNAVSIYAKFFDEYNKNWVKNAEYNMMFLKCQQNNANDMLHARGHIFLNEVYDMLGIERTEAGQIVGWVLSEDGDNFVDFGLYRGDSEAVREFVNGHERSILLDFNVDGVVFDKI